MGKCDVMKGLLLHVDAPVKQYILSLNETHDYAIVLSNLPDDETKIFVNKTFTDTSGIEHETDIWLQSRLDEMLNGISFNPNKTSA